MAYFHKQIVSNQDPSVVFTLAPLTRELVISSAELLTDIFLQDEPINLFFKPKRENFLHFCTEFAKKNCRENIGIVVLSSSNELIGACLNEDYYTVESDNFLTPEILSYDGVREFCTLTQKNFDQNPDVFPLPAEPRSHVHLDLWGIHQKYQRHGIFKQLINFVIKEHPLLKNTKKFTVEPTSDISTQGFLKNGFRVHRETLLEDFLINENGEKPMEGFEEKMKEIGKNGCKFTRLLIWDRN